MTDTPPTPMQNAPRDAAPMTATLMGRLFVVPALVVVVLLGVAVVVILFGASPIEKPRTIAELLDEIETDSGDRSIGGFVLSPRSKQAWQSAQELGVRFDQGRIDPGEVEPTAARIIKIIRERRAGTAMDDDGLAMQQFLIVALAKLKSPSAVDSMMEMLGDSDPRIRRVALQGLAEMRDTAGVRSSLSALYPMLNDDAQEVRIVAALAISAIAERGDATAIGKIAAMPATDRESQMNRATALAKLGSARGKLMLLNMLDRSYWKALPPETADAAAVARPLSDAEISDRLMALAPIAAGLDDADVVGAVRVLSEQDASPQVRDAARTALAEAGKSGEPAAQAKSREVSSPAEGGRDERIAQGSN